MRLQIASPVLLGTGCFAGLLSRRSMGAAVEQVILQAMEKYHTPGAAIAVVTGNETWSKGFGYANIEKNIAVDSSTLFWIGSTTKAHTAAALSLLVDQGHIGWETPVHTVLGDDFDIMDDDWSTNHLTVTDFLSHRTGIPRYDMAIRPTAVENVRSLRYLPLTAEPRTMWQYSNHNYGVAGYLIEKLTSSNLSDFMTENLWKPMGMDRTYLNRQDVDGLATPYSWNNDTNSSEPRVVPNLSGLEGAGAMVSNVDDFAKYLQVMLNVTTGPLSPNGIAAILGNHMLESNVSTPNMFTGASWYGLGWDVGVLNGVLTYNHGGDVGQFGSYAWMFPEIQAGFMIMTNQMGAFVQEVGDRLAYTILGIAEDEQASVDALAAANDLQQELLLENCVAISYPTLVAGSASSNSTPGSLSKYAGNYVHPAFGNITLVVDCPTGSPKSQVMAENSPANPTFDANGCVLRTGHFDSPDEGFRGELQYVGSIPDQGEAWIAWIYALGRERYYGPKYCMMVVSDKVENGSVAALHANSRLVPGTELFVFNRTGASGSPADVLLDTGLGVAPT